MLEEGDRELWKGRQWHVTDGPKGRFVEEIAGDYWIGMSDDHRRLQNWPLHMSEKRWVDFPDFCDAMRAAYRLFGLDLSPLETEITVALQRRKAFDSIELQPGDPLDHAVEMHLYDREVGL